MAKSKIYTRTGDKGQTSLVGGKRVSKTHPRLNAYGTVDELNSFVGWLACSVSDKEQLELLSFIQHKLFVVGAHLATEKECESEIAAIVIHNQDIDRVENMMDAIDASLPTLNQFILPGGCESASRAHICRSVCRRAERMILEIPSISDSETNTVTFINRLSDYFFLLARKEATKNGNEIHWQREL